MCGSHCRAVLLQTVHYPGQQAGMRVRVQRAVHRLHAFSVCVYSVVVQTEVEVKL